MSPRPHPPTFEKPSTPPVSYALTVKECSDEQLRPPFNVALEHRRSRPLLTNGRRGGHPPIYYALTSEEGLFEQRCPPLNVPFVNSQKPAHDRFVLLRQAFALKKFNHGRHCRPGAQAQQAFDYQWAGRSPPIYYALASEEGLVEQRCFL